MIGMKIDAKSVLSNTSLGVPPSFRTSLLRTDMSASWIVLHLASHFGGTTLDKTICLGSLYCYIPL